jgi:molybdate/tungstate transport system ATP-binding protein
MTLEIDGIVKAYDGFELGPIDLTVDQEVLSVLGPSGCGKTTLLWLVAGLMRPDAGSVSLGGRSLNDRPPEARGTGLVFQDGALFPNMTARENIAYASADSGRVEELAETFEIEGVLDRHPHALSGGERQRVALARTLATEPDALLLDEPLSSLDAPIRRRLRTELAALFESIAIPVVLVTHDQRTATALGNRVTVLRDGIVEQVGTPTEVLTQPVNEFVAKFTGNENVFRGDVVSQNGQTVVVRAGEVSINANGCESVGSAVSACIHPARVRVRGITSERKGCRNNTVSGRIRRLMNEGDGYRAEITVEDAPITLTAAVSPPRFDELSVAVGSEVSVTLPQEDVHLIHSPRIQGN